jgi:undecaprenyl phosphate-alpha-L-ara4N flippase subunit ArnE
VTLTLVLLFGTVLCDVAGQTCFKLGVGHDGESRSSLLRMIFSRWIVVGVLIYVVEFTVWFAALSMAPLSVAFPFMALSYCGVVLASRFVLGEPVSGQRWFATLAIAVGVALVCAP